MICDFHPGELISTSISRRYILVSALTSRMHCLTHLRVAIVSAVYRPCLRSALRSRALTLRLDPHRDTRPPLGPGMMKVLCPASHPAASL